MYIRPEMMEKGLIRKVEGAYTQYFCPFCGKKMGEIHDSGTGFFMSDCEHYYWEVVSTTCFYEDLSDCDLDYIRQLKQNYIIKAFSGTNVYLLLSRNK